MIHYAEHRLAFLDPPSGKAEGIGWSVLALTNDWWHHPWMPQHYILDRLAARHRVLFVETPLEVRGWGRQVAARRGHPAGLRQIRDGLLTWMPPFWLPVNYRYPRLEHVVSLGRLVALKRTLRRLRFRNPIAFAVRPEYHRWVGRLGEGLICYYVMDDYEGLVTGAEAKRRVRAEEEQMLAKADLVFVHARSLISVRGLGSRAQWLPNGVDFDAFDHFRRSGSPEPADIGPIPRPRTGYVGRINQKVDFGLLEHIARARPQWSIVLVGPVLLAGRPEQAEWRRLTALPNVYALGRKDRSELPAYMSALDVGLMCYQVRDWVVHGYPLKMHEYFASGVPVVSSDLMAVREFKGLLSCATAPDEWLSAIEAGLEEGRARAAERIAVARANSWEARVATIERAIAGALGHGGLRR